MPILAVQHPTLPMKRVSLNEEGRGLIAQGADRFSRGYRRRRKPMQTALKSSQARMRKNNTEGLAVWPAMAPTCPNATIIMAEPAAVGNDQATRYCSLVEVADTTARLQHVKCSSTAAAVAGRSYSAEPSSSCIPQRFAHLMPFIQVVSRASLELCHPPVPLMTAMNCQMVTVSREGSVTKPASPTMELLPPIMTSTAAEAPSSTPVKVFKQSTTCTQTFSPRSYQMTAKY